MTNHTMPAQRSGGYDASVFDELAKIEDRHFWFRARLILTVPAHQFLWSHFDEAAHHCRRYSTSQLRQSLEETGFAVDFLSQFMACIFPLVWMVRKLGGLAGKGDPAASKKQAMQEFRV